MGFWPVRHRWLAAAAGGVAVLIAAGAVPATATAARPGAQGRPAAAATIWKPTVPAALGRLLAVIRQHGAAGARHHRPAGAFSLTAAGRAGARASDGRTGCSAAWYHGDERLGPAKLPDAGHLGDIMYGYHRLGGLSARRFLDVFWNPAAGGGKGGWRYPPQDGYVLDASHHPDLIVARLTRGLRMDRFGPPAGTYLSPYGTPFDMRALPPESLDGTPAAGCNYYAYQVTRRFDVDAGGVARWFRQPGYGYQYHLDGGLIPGAPAHISVTWLISHGYLRQIAP